MNEQITDSLPTQAQVLNLQKQLFGIARMLHSIGVENGVPAKLLRDNYNNAFWTDEWLLEDTPNLNV